jgi:hypothetical protein
MLLTEDIFLLSAKLTSDQGFCSALHDQLELLFGSASYQAWIGTLAESEPYQLSEIADVGLLEAAGLAQRGRLLAKINCTAGGIFLTDGVWVEPRIRVFPFCDESAALRAFVQTAGLDNWARWTLDLATGCGHTAIGTNGRRIGFDINPRALAYAAANRTLNGVAGRDCSFALNDIRDGIPPAVSRGLDGHVLVLANMPFGPAPSRDALPLTSNGGESGIDLQLATYRAVDELVRAAEGRFTLHACIMGLTVGDRAADRWEIVEGAIARFGAGRVRWHLLSDDHVFRIDGVRQLGNPAPVSVALPGLASCRL